MEKEQILIIEDDPDIREGVRILLESENYEVREAPDGAKGLAALEESTDLVILDVMMPKKDGLEACQEIRSFSTVPIIMLTARSEDADKIIGLESGADDYVTKPFNILELKARIRALLRRASMPAAGPSAAVIERRGLEIDTDKRAVRKNGRPVDLTAREFDLVELFIKNPGRVYSRDNLLNLVWGYDYQGDERTVDVHIRRLREKIEDDPASPRLIITKWGVGYYFAE